MKRSIRTCEQPPSHSARRLGRSHRSSALAVLLWFATTTPLCLAWDNRRSSLLFTPLTFFHSSRRKAVLQLRGGWSDFLDSDGWYEAAATEQCDADAKPLNAHQNSTLVHESDSLVPVTPPPNNASVTTYAHDNGAADEMSSAETHNSSETLAPEDVSDEPSPDDAPPLVLEASLHANAVDELSVDIEGEDTDQWTNDSAIAATEADALSGDDSKEHASAEPEAAMDVPSETFPSPERDGANPVDDAYIPLVDESIHGASDPTVHDPTTRHDPVDDLARHLRSQGKDYHDQGDFTTAASTFGQAAHHVWTALVTPHASDTAARPTDTLVLDYCTLRLHQALCALKAHDFALAVEATTAVIDLVTTLPSHTGTWLAGVVMVPAPLRARALYRRAKARLGEHERTVAARSAEELETDESESEETIEGESLAAMALSDARAAAFLGDGKAVALYGKLLRSNNAHADESLDSPPAAWSSSRSSSGSSDLLQQLLSSSLGGSSAVASKSGMGSPSSPITSMISSMMLGNKAKSQQRKNGANDMVKSVWNMALQRMDDPSTQDTICSFLQKTSDTQLQQWTSMAGIPLPPTQAQRMAKFCRSVTPKLLRSTMAILKRIVYVVQLLRQMGRILTKYRMLIVAWILLWWVQSAVWRPLPIRGRNARAAAMQVAGLATTAAATGTATERVMPRGPMTNAQEIPVGDQVNARAPILNRLR